MRQIEIFLLIFVLFFCFFISREKNLHPRMVESTQYISEKTGHRKERKKNPRVSQENEKENVSDFRLPLAVS